MKTIISENALAAARDYTVSVGADPEFFLTDNKNSFVSAHGLVKGSKREPHPLTVGAVQLDGTAIEFNIAPSFTQSEFRNNVERTLKEIRDIVPKDYNFNISPSAWFDREYFDKEVPQSSKELGCEPDYSAYKNGAPNPRPNGDIIKDGKVLRTGAGHIHIGWTEGADVTSEQHRWDCILLAKNLDRFFAICEKFWDTDVTRRSMYGAPGAYRPKSYGMEYRSLSNAWVNHHSLYNFIYDATVFVFRATLLGVEVKPYLAGQTEEYFNRYYRRGSVEFYNATRPAIISEGGNRSIVAPAFPHISNSARTVSRQLNGV